MTPAGREEKSSAIVDWNEMIWSALTSVPKSRPRLRYCASSRPASRSEVKTAVDEFSATAEARYPVSSFHGGPGLTIEHAAQSFCVIHSVGFEVAMVPAEPAVVVSVTVAPWKRAPDGTGLRSQWMAPLNAPPVLNAFSRQNCWVLLTLLLPWSRARMTTESSGVPGSSVWNERTVPARRSCVVWFSLVTAQ